MPDLVKTDRTHSLRLDATSRIRSGAGTYLQAGDVHKWLLPGATAEIYLHSSTLKHFAVDLAGAFRANRPEEETGGLLIGSRDCSHIRISGVITYCTSALHDVIGNAKGRETSAGESSIVGWYRIDSKNRLDCTQQDESLIRGHFADQMDIFILIEACELSASAAAFFFWRDEKLTSALSIFPALPMAGAPVTGDGRFAPGLRIGRLLKPAVTAVATALLILAGADALRRKDSPAPVQPRQGAIRTDRELNFAATAEADGVRVTWNRHAADVLRAQWGLLSVKAGEEWRDIPLDSLQLSVGLYRYSAAAGAIQVKLYLVRQNEKRLMETAAVIVPSTGSLQDFDGRSQRKSEFQSLAKPRAELVTASPSQRATPSAAVLSEIPRQSLPVVKLPQSTPALPQPPLAQLQGPNFSTESFPDVGSPVALPESLRSVPPPLAPPTGNGRPPLDGVNEVPTQPSPSIPQGEEHPITPPWPIRQPRPVVPPSLQALITRDIQVEVSLTIDANGKVLSADRVGAEGAVAATLGALAAETARLWRFEPSRRGEHAIPSTLNIQFKFGPRPRK